MEKKSIYNVIFVFCLVFVSGCNEFIRTQVEAEIYINKKSINGFIGEEVQLIASPSGVGYDFKWSSENNDVASVSSSGLVTLIGNGTTNILVNTGLKTTKIEVISVLRVPINDVIMSESLLNFFPGDKKLVTFQRLPVESNDIPEFRWTSENTNVATVNERGEVTAIGLGVTNIIFKLGNIVKSIKVDVSPTKPFNGPHNLIRGSMYELKAADFDFGGQGFAFNDDSGNAIGNDNYRKGKGDVGSFAVEVEGDGNNIGYINRGEWLQYTVNATEEGDYLMDLLLSGVSNGAFHIEVNNIDVTGRISVPANGSWSSWVNVPSTPFVIRLNKGLNKIKVYIEEAGFNFKSFRLKLAN